MNPIAEDILMHYGVKRRSGRYPWGSGDDPYQHSGDFLSRVQELKKQGLKETDIVKAMGLDSTTQLRVAYSTAKNERRRLEVDRVNSLISDGYNTSEIARMMGKNESSIRSLMNENSTKNMNQAENTANKLREEIAKKRIIDVGAQVNRELGVSATKLDEAVFMLEAEGYKCYGVGLPQPNSKGKQTTVKVLCDKDVEWSYVYKNPGEIQSVGEYHSIDGGVTWSKREYPASIDSSRVKIRYGDEGGTSKDGVIEIRRGVKDLDLGPSHYAQVRIMVDGTHYLKGMAMYSDDIPAGSDIVFNTNKNSGTDKMKVLKKIKDDPDNPFGAYIKANGQSHYIDDDGKEKLSAINKLKEEGDWDKISKNLSSQFLSKQPMKLIKQQLKLTYADAEDEFDEICSITNPTVKRKLLLEFADECDSATVHLKAAALPRQSTRVILPIDALKETEAYAPYLKQGEKVCLIRYPHAGTFEIPELVVNNKNPSAKSILGNVTDAIGINAKVAERLSGADFDGDQVMVIPVNDRVRVKSTPALEGLKNFDPKVQYSTEGKKGVSLLTEDAKQKQMGIVSNLITDMTLAGAPQSDIVRAVKHSMVVIDAVKHELDYKQSEKDNGIAQLKIKYQPKYDDDGNPTGKGGGAKTLISNRKQDVAVPERRGSAMIDPETGKVTYKESGRTYVDKRGSVKEATINVPRIRTVDDAHLLSSGTPQETAYADYANKMKALANKARKEYANTGRLKYNPSAKITYSQEVSKLMSDLNIAAKNAPRERRALAIANSVIKAKKQAYPNMDADEEKKIKRIAMDEARISVGASGKHTRINITDRGWEAIQAGAFSDSKVAEILKYADPDAVRERALPRTTTQLTPSKVNRVKAMNSSGHTIAEIAEQLNISTTTVSKYLNNQSN